MKKYPDIKFNIRAYRKTLNLNIEDMCDLLGVEYRTYQRHEKKGTIPLIWGKVLGYDGLDGTTDKHSGD